MGTLRCPTLPRACGDAGRRAPALRNPVKVAQLQFLPCFSLASADSYGLRMRVSAKPLPARNTWEGGRFTCTLDHLFFQTIYGLQCLPSPHALCVLPPMKDSASFKAIASLISSWKLETPHPFPSFHISLSSLSPFSLTILAGEGLVSPLPEQSV